MAKKQENLKNFQMFVKRVIQEINQKELDEIFNDFMTRPNAPKVSLRID